MSERPSFFAELKRRNVIRAATFYAASAWLVVQIATQVFPLFNVPNWMVGWIVVAAMIGFPFAMLFSWFYEWTPQGIQRESDVMLGESIVIETGRKLDRLIIVVLGVAVVLLLTNQFVLRKDAIPAAADSPGLVAPAVADALAAPIPDKSIAVLPLANQGGNKDEQYFSDGLSEDLITALAQFSSLKVISRNSSFQFRDSKEDAAAIGRKLGVAHLLEGSVRREGDMVRISAELVHAADGIAVWSRNYDRPYKDLFKLQDEITGAVAIELQAKLLTVAGAVVQSDRPPSGNLDAYKTWLLGKDYKARNTEADVRKAIELYATATRFDPRYAQAWASLSGAWTTLSRDYLGGTAAVQAYAQARTAANTALALAPDLAEAHMALAYLLLETDMDFGGSEAENRRALQLAPDDPTAKFNLGSSMAIMGRVEPAIDLTRQALATDPRNAAWHASLADYLSATGRLDEADQAIGKAIALQPDASGYHLIRMTIAIQRGDAKAAMAAALLESAGPFHDIAVGQALQVGNDRHAADAALRALIATSADYAGYQIAQIHALRKDPDNMFAWLDRAWTHRDTGITTLLYDPIILRYRNDPRFAVFCKKAGLPTTTTSKAIL